MQIAQTSSCQHYASNALRVTATVYHYREESVTEKKQPPGRPGVVAAGFIHIALHGDGVGAPYNAVSMCTHAPEGRNKDSSTSTKPEEVPAQMPKTFSPEHVRPFPKAPPRQQTNKGRKKRESAILTDTPEKNALEEEVKKSTNKSREGKKVRTKLTSEKTKIFNRHSKKNK